ncbi:MAG: putative LPS assembly protein LptD [Flavobacteriaceae bacterium]
MRTKLFHIVFWTFFWSIFPVSIYSQESPLNTTDTKPKQTTDSIRVQTTELPEEITIPADSLKPKKDKLEGIIARKAKDYNTINHKKRISKLYNQAFIKYMDMELEAGEIIIDYNKNEVYAKGIVDTSGVYTQIPKFTQGQNIVEPDSMRYNFDTGKALVYGSRTEQGEMRIKAPYTKRENDSVFYMKDAIFTTATDIDNPEYYFHTRKLKMVPGEKVVVGVTNMVIMDVPTPVGLPFAFFPITTKNTSGFIVPTFGDNNTQGYFLQNGGYYFALSDHYDLAVLGDYYTNGSYGLRFQSSYAWRYKFRGSTNIRLENLINSQRGFPDYSKTRIYNIQWSHQQDQKSNPSSRFSASVNLGSSTYFQNSINQINVSSRMNNTLSSSVSYSKTFNTIPQVNMSLTATHSQNTQTQRIDMTLPTLQLSVDRIYPFASRDESKKGIIKNINFQYNLNAKNSYTTTDSLFFTSQMFQEGRTGMQHSIPVSTNFKVLKHFSIPLSFSYNEVWTMNTINKYRNFTTDRDTIVNINGFDAFRTYNFSTSVGTTIYGTFDFGKDKKVQALRHTARPSVSYNYSPAFEQYYDEYPIDAMGTTMREYTRFEGGLYGAPNNNYASSLGFNLANSFEAKVRERDSTKTEPKKLMLLNALNFATSYNMATDSLRWSPVSMNAGTTLMEGKLNMNLIARLDPYALSNSNRRIDKFNIDNGGSLFRLAGANFTLNYSFSSSDFEGRSSTGNNDIGARNGGREDDLFGSDMESNRQNRSGKEDKNTSNISDFYSIKIPWDLRLAYSVTYSNDFRQNEITSNSLMVSGNVDLSDKWKIGVSTGYDFVQKGITFTQLRFERDLLSWRMDFSWVPYGVNTHWGFFIGIKSSMLQDIKWEKRKTPDPRF